jgi:MFS family permease
MHSERTVRVTATRDQVREVLERRFDAHPDELGAPDTYGATVRNDPTTTGRVTFTITAVDDDPSAVDLHIDAGTELDVAFFRSIVDSLLEVHYLRVVDWTAEVVDHELAGAAEPEPPRPVPLLPTVPFSPAQATLLMTAGAAIAVATFAQSIVGQFASTIATSFGTNDDGLGVSLAILRSGLILSLVLAALADRIGRRRIVLGTIVGCSVCNLLSAFAPNLVTFTIVQTLTRGFAAAVVIAAGIAAIEEAPEGGRAYATSILALTGGAGFTLTVILLPLADRFSWAWRGVFLLSAASIVMYRPIARALVESHRYERIVDAKITRGRWSDIFKRGYASRFWLLAAAAFLTNLLAAPSSQLMNKYLTDVHGFSNSQIVLLRAVTTAIPGFIGLILAGRLSERYGRRPVAAISLAIGAIVRAAFFLGTGPVLWFASALGDLALACGFIAIGVLNTELFPTETRGTSNGMVALIGVVGSAVGLVMAGVLSDPLGGLGRSIALTTIGTFVAAVVVVPFLPESAHLDLDEVSPSKADPELL